VIDNHCHLEMTLDGSDELTPERALEVASDVGVTRIVQIGCELESARWSVEVADRVAGIVAGVSLHPNEAPRLAAAGRFEQTWEEIERLATRARVRAVGETGLDYYRTGEEGRGAQEHSFRLHIDLAKRLGKTLVIHDRDAHEDVLRVLDDEGSPERVVMHCFSGDAEFARACLERGFWLSFAGTVTFKNAQDLRDAAALVPPDRLLVETDAPFLTPMPHRGRPNASYLVPHTMRLLADLRGNDLGELCGAVERNTFAAYGGSWD
jgi:TatD DNase family protein